MRTSLSKAIALLAGASLIGLCSAVASAQNLFANASFEDPITSDGPPFVGFWEGFSGGGAFSVNGGQMPRTGNLHARFGIDNTVNTFAGAFQDVPGLVPGSGVTFSGWHATPSSPLDVGVEIRIEWRDSVANTEVARTPNLTVAPGASYS